MKVVEWILNTRGTDIWPHLIRSSTRTRWPYAFITHCCIKDMIWENNGLCNTYSEGDTLKLYLDPLGCGFIRHPEIGEDYEARG